MFSIEKKMGVGEGGGGLGARNSSFITFRPLYTKQVKIRDPTFLELEGKHEIHGKWTRMK